MILGACTGGTPQGNSLWPQATASTASWNVVGAVGFTPGNTGSANLQLAPDGTPFVEFLDWNTAGYASVEKFVNGAWSFVGSEGFSLGAISDDALALDDSGVPYVAYQDTASTKLAVLKFDGSWNPPGPATLISSGAAASVSMVIDKQERPCVAFSDATVTAAAPGGGGITVLRWNPSTTNWDMLGVEGFSGNYCSDTSMARDAAGNIYVAYTDMSDGSNKVTAREYNESTSTWDLVGPQFFSPSSAAGSSLKIGLDNVPYIAFLDQGVSSSITVMKYAGGAWVLVGSRGISANWVGAPSLAVGPGATLYVAYPDANPSNRAVVLKYTGTAWVSVGSSTGISAGAMQNASLVIDSTGMPYIGYRDVDNGYRLTVLGYR